MKKIFLTLVILTTMLLPANAWDFATFGESIKNTKETWAVKRLLKSQVKFANDNDFEKFISTYDEKYVNADGFNLDTYSTLVKDLWNLYADIEYGIDIKKVDIKGEDAKVELVETSYADIDVTNNYDGELKSVAESIYYLKKKNGAWKVISDSVVDETTLMLYGDAKDLDVKLTVPITIEAGTDYVATLEFDPPEETFAIASIAADKVEYPQQPTKEVFRLLPEDNILERIFTSNNDNLNEYIVASIGLTKTTITDMSLNISLTGFGYAIRRVNVLPKEDLEQKSKAKNDENK